MVAIKDKLKIEIVEHNNEVLPIIIRDIGVHLKSGEDIALLRFDSYADLLVPKGVQADEIETSNHLVASITNQSWILPAVYRGYITKIFWFKPPWAHQFQDGKYQLQVGKCQQTGVLKCVDDGYCSLEQADLIQRYVEKKFRKLYKIDETIGKSLLTNDDNDDELDEDDPKDRKSMIISDDENSHLSTNGTMNRPIINNEKSLTNETLNTNKHLSLHNENDISLSPTLSTNNRLLSSLSNPSPGKGNPSPGEITKTMSPSSLSEASPILD
ncbi:unnamed protein product [Rotaria sp. Silwood2]|nr:unnamed protein product [Rotaria sp. Silwood2]